jgi:hypothetical protein
MPTLVFKRCGCSLRCGHCGEPPGLLWSPSSSEQKHNDIKGTGSSDRGVPPGLKMRGWWIRKGSPLGRTLTPKTC